MSPRGDQADHACQCEGRTNEQQGTAGESAEDSPQARDAEGDQDRVTAAADRGGGHCRHRPSGRGVVWVGGQAQQEVGRGLRNRPAAMRRLSAMVRYGAQVSATSSTVISARIA